MDSQRAWKVEGSMKGHDLVNEVLQEWESIVSKVAKREVFAPSSAGNFTSHFTPDTYTLYNYTDHASMLEKICTCT